MSSDKLKLKVSGIELKSDKSFSDEIRDLNDLKLIKLSKMV